MSTNRPRPRRRKRPVILADPEHTAEAIDCGHAVIPLRFDGYPATRHGHLDARTGDDARRWLDMGNTRFAIVLDGLTLLDLDNKHEGKNGMESVAVLEERLGALPATPWRVLTPNAGRHLFYRGAPELDGRRLVGVQPGLDVLCAGWARMAGNSSPYVGRYILEGAIVPAAELPALPQAWVDFFVAEAERTAPKRVAARASGGPDGVRDPVPYFHTALDRICADLAAKTDGQLRRKFLNDKAFKLGTIAPNDFAVREARRKLFDAAISSGLDASTATRYLEDGLNDGLARADLERRSAS